MCGVYRDWSSYALGETMNALFQSEAFIDSLKIHCADVKHKYLFRVYTAFCVSRVKGETGNCYVVDGSEG